jgi:hypothetical protein
VGAAVFQNPSSLIQQLNVGYSPSLLEAWNSPKLAGWGSWGLSGLPMLYALLTQSFRCCNKGPEAVRYPSGWYKPRRHMVGLRKVLGVARAGRAGHVVAGRRGAVGGLVRAGVLLALGVALR